MRILTTFLLVGLLATVALAQAHNEPNAKTKEELQKLFTDLNEAIVKKDRATLERIYADEFQFVHNNGYIVNKATQINRSMTNDPVSAEPVATPSFDNFITYGDVAILRTTMRGIAGTNIFAKRDGRWQVVQVQGTRLAPERKALAINPALLDSFPGKYQFGPNAIATVTREGDTLKWRAGNRLPVTLVPLSETRFFAKENESEMSFTKSEKGQVTDVVLKLGVCQETRAKRIE
ncbi:MAG TPA: DUF4440 domain-containing protein [Pyrinomonadaceae bacterium]|jgi:hypothetical protein|nr:DUF4440 domain-containing protein [Pyrinomonadaceae bacterium]